MTDVKIIAHRGANKYAPQNTLPAFERAVELGATGFETDVHVTKDGVPVICHNYTINDTSNGIGSISSYTLDELKKFDFGTYFSSRFEGTKIPTLDEFLEFVAASAIEVMNIELKKPREKKSEIVEKTIKAVKEHGLFNRLLISSFDPKLLIEAKKIDPRCKTGFLYAPSHPETLHAHIFPVLFAKHIGADALHPMDIYVNKQYVKAAHSAGIKVNVWTVNNEASISRFIKAGVDGIITDCPDRVRKILRSIK